MRRPLSLLLLLVCVCLLPVSPAAGNVGSGDEEAPTSVTEEAEPPANDDPDAAAPADAEPAPAASPARPTTPPEPAPVVPRAATPRAPMLAAHEVPGRLRAVESEYDRGNWESTIKAARDLMTRLPPDHPSRGRAYDLLMLAMEYRSRDLAKQHAVRERQKSESDARQLLVNATGMIEKKDFAGAKLALEEAIGKTPKDPEAHYLLGLACRGAKDDAGAFVALKTCLQLRPEHAEARLLHVELAYKLQRYGEAGESVQRLRTHYENETERLRNERQRQVQASLLDKAAATARRLEALRPRHARAHFLAGLIATERGDHRAARDAFQASLKLAGASIDLYDRLGRASFNAGNHHQAALAFEQALLIGETRLRELKKQARALLDQGESDKAVTVGIEQKRLETTLAGIHYEMALAAWRKSENQIALTQIDRALELKPDLMKARFARGLFYASVRDYSRALFELREVLRRSEPGSSEAEVAVRAIRELMDRSTMAAHTGAGPVASLTVIPGYPTSKLVKDLPGLGGRQREDEWADILPRFRAIQALIDRDNLPEAMKELQALIRDHPMVPHGQTRPDHYYPPHGHTTLAPSYLPQAHTLMAHCYLRQGRLADAGAHFQTALKLHSSQAEAKSGLAYVYALEGKRLPEALKLAREAVNSDRDRAEFHHTLGWVLYRQGEVEAAISALQQALRLDPAHRLARYNLGLAQYMSGRLREALEAFEAVLVDAPQHDKALLFKALTHAKLGDPAQAIAALGELKAILPHDQTLGKVVAQLETRFKLAVERQMALPVPAVKHPANLEPLLAKARIHRQNGMVNRAKELYLECQRLIPGNFASVYELGELYAENGLHRPAIRTWQQALQIDPNYFPLQLNLGKVYHHLRDRPAAITHFARAQALRPNDPDAFYYLGLIAFEQQDYLTAESHARAALRQNPKLMKARALLGTALIHRKLYRKARDEFEGLYAKAPAGSSIQRFARKKLWELTRLMSPNRFPSDGHLQQVVADLDREQEAKAQTRITPADPIRPGTPKAGGVLSKQDKLRLLQQISSFGALKKVYTVAPPPPPPADLRLSTLKTVRRDDPADGDLREAIGLMERGFIEAARDRLIAAKGKANRNLELLLGLGYLQMLRGNFRDAFDAFAEAADQFPDDPLPAIALGNLYWQGGQADDAVTSWRRVTGRKVRLHKELNLLPRAEAAWRKMLTIHPSDPDAHSNLGLILLFSGRAPEAVAEFEGVLNLAPDRSENRFYLAQAHAQRYFVASSPAHRKSASAALDRLSQQSPPFPHSAHLFSYLQSH